jgi:hypothetical protein
MTNDKRSTHGLRPWMAAAVLAFAGHSALAAQPAALKPFSADYQASYMGLQGSGRMVLAKAGDSRWKYSLDIHSTIANLSQSTVFDEHGGQWRPLSGNDSSLLLIKKSDKHATYDWAHGQARWSGDVKSDRSGPVALKPGDMDAMLINLAIARDVQAGKPQSATKVARTDGDRQTLLWVVDGLPVPARILQRKGGSDEMDLQLTSID